MDVFSYVDALACVKAFIKAQPKDGHGQVKRIAGRLKLSSTAVSLALKGERPFSEEQGIELAQYLGFNPRESDYFLLLIRHAKAGSAKLKAYLIEQIQEARLQARDLEARLSQDFKLDAQTRAIYYSDPIYAAARVAISLPEVQTVSDIAQRLGLEQTRAKEVCAFLVHCGLLQEALTSDQRAILSNGPARLHLGSKSPYVKTRQIQWRLKAFARMEGHDGDHLFYTGPMSLSKEACERARGKLARVIEEIQREAMDSDPSELFCLNIDWFDF